MNMLRHSLILSLASICLVPSSLFAKEATENCKTNNDIILHAWTWSFNSIKTNLKDISNAGFTIIQTSPANECCVGDNGGMELFGNGKWYYHYQPTDWQIGNYQMGTRDDFKSLCNEANKYGLKIIVDVLPNHTVIDDTKISAKLDSAVGGRKNLFHANGRNPIVDYNDRYQCTTGEMGKLPDVNTENPDFQYYYMQYVNDLLACGAKGFRYDTAKHIGLPSDPLDAKSPQNDFWDVAMGRKTVKGLRMSVIEDSLFIYGEVLQDKNVKEKEYSEYMQLTASNYGHKLRNVLNNHSSKSDNLLDWIHPTPASRLITWVESHDTYCNAHESAVMSNDLVRMGWVFLVARQNGTPLFFSRPNGSTRENYWGNNKIGECGNDEFKHPEVAQANKFRKFMNGENETIFFSNDGKIIEVARGNKGVALINIAEETVKVEIATTLPDGVYTDLIYNNTFKVKKGMIKGSLKPLTSYILY